MQDTLPILLLGWLVAIAVLAAGRAWQCARGSGLVLAYVLNLWLIHWLGPALYLLPWYGGFERALVTEGLQESTLAVAAFAFSSFVLTPFILNFGILPVPTARHQPDRKLPMAYIAVGVVSFALMTAAANIPSATAIVTTGYKLVVVGLALSCWFAWRTNNIKRMMFWLALTLALPFVTMTTMGFIGYGAAASLTVLAFMSGFIKNKWALAAATLCVAYVGLSVYVTYMRDRSQIRASVWTGDSYRNRLAQIGQTFTAFEWFDLSDERHLETVDKRLNQSYLVGLAVSRMENSGEFVKGETLSSALLALIPRAIWKEKPDELAAGSGTLVTRFTGLRFDRATSVGIGHVMEFYVNFGSVGVVAGFVFMGFLVTLLDTMAAQNLAMDDLHGFVLWFLPGVSLLQVGGSFIEMTTGAVASLVVATAANTYLRRLQQKQGHLKATRFAGLEGSHS